ncbi:MAG TPA: metal-dependent phosphohydrolase [Candidatus Paceibacterota bacterium]
MTTTHNELKKRWNELMKSLGVNDARGEIFNDLVARYSEPHRRYHTLEHIVNMLREFAKVKAHASYPKAVEFAIWFHDAIYDTRREDNEQASAKLAVEAVKKLGITNGVFGDIFSPKVYELVLTTEYKRLPGDADEDLLADLDLATLASDPEIFDENMKKIREEYSWLSDEQFKWGRIMFMRNMLSRPRIYSSPRTREKYDARARANLERSIKKLKEE